jgi:hypothetical protein
LNTRARTQFDKLFAVEFQFLRKTVYANRHEFYSDLFESSAASKKKIASTVKIPETS